MRRNVILILVLLICSGYSYSHKRILFIGDSITDGGWGKSGGHATPSDRRNLSDLNHIYGQSYMMLCASYYQSAYPDSDYQFYNRGISGNTLYDMSARWKKDALDLHPDVVSILIGTNDIHFYLDSLSHSSNMQKPFDFPAWTRQYRLLLDQLLQQNPCVHIILGIPFVAKEGKYGAMASYSMREQMVKRLAEIVRDIARDYHLKTVEYDTMFRSLVQHEPRKGYWIWDGIHPTPAGHKRMSDLWIHTADEFIR